MSTLSHGQQPRVGKSGEVSTLFQTPQASYVPPLGARVTPH